MILETRRGRVAQHEKEHTHERNEHLAASVREEIGHVERIQDGDGTLERGNYDEPDAHEQSRVRQDVLHGNAGREYGQFVHFDDVREEFYGEKEAIGDGHGRDEQRGVGIAHAFAAHDNDAEQVSNETEHEQEEQTNVPEVPRTSRREQRQWQ